MFTSSPHDHQIIHQDTFNFLLLSILESFINERKSDITHPNVDGLKVPFGASVQSPNVDTFRDVNTAGHVTNVLQRTLNTWKIHGTNLLTIKVNCWLRVKFM